MELCHATPEMNTVELKICIIIHNEIAYLHAKLLTAALTGSEGVGI